MKHLEALAATLFGASFLLLGFAVTVETLMRKVLNRSLQGVDELGGYLLAFGAALAMATALLGRTHIRIDLLHDFAPRALRVLLNVCAAVALVASALVLTRMASIALEDSHLFQSTAQTPWATPLWIPQTFWLGGLALFAGVAALHAGQLLVLVVQRRWKALDLGYGPRGARDELSDELADIRQRGVIVNDGRPS
jgi:TRAP-type C4-dicarboxylate transport system permease small subunit